MIHRLILENIAIIDSLQVDFHSGLTIITGETGSGKSILMDAMGWVLGGKGNNKDILRSGAQRGRIEVWLDPRIPARKGTTHQVPLGIEEFLKDHQLEGSLALLGPETDASNEIPTEAPWVLSREITGSSNRFRLNGVPVTRDIMEGLRSFLLDFHGQHELTGLFQKSVQRDFLDGLGGGDLQTLKQSVSSCYSRWQQAKKAYQENQAAQQAFEAQRDFLQFQCNELEGAELKDPDEDVTLQSTLDRLTHLERLQGFTQQSIQWLVEGEWEKTPAISDALGKVQKALGEAARLDASLIPFTEEVTRLVEDTKALASSLTHYHESLEGNPQALSHLVDRLDQLEKLKRKYGPTLPEVLATFEKIQEALATQDQFQHQLESLKATVDLEETVLSQLCNELTQKREALAIELASSLIQELQALAMPKVQFQVTITPKALGADGKDDIGFLFSANPGEDLRPLAKVASGGELSRVLFGLKVLTAGSTTLETAGSSTLLFDEIDTGMSGMALRSVGERLRLLSQSRQVFVITHQPLVAAMGDHHLHVQKEVRRDQVKVEIQSLEEKEKRLNVLSRLASGIDTDDEAVDIFVQRLLHQAETWKIPR